MTAPVITANWSAAEDERWTVPVGIGLSKVSAISRESMSLGAQCYHNATRPSTAGSDQFRFQFTLLYPNTALTRRSIAWCKRRATRRRRLAREQRYGIPESVIDVGVPSTWRRCG